MEIQKKNLEFGGKNWKFGKNRKFWKKIKKFGKNLETENFVENSGKVWK